MSVISKNKREIDVRRVLAWSSAVAAVVAVVVGVVMGLISIWSNNHDLASKCGTTAAGAGFTAMITAAISGLAFDE